MNMTKTCWLNRTMVYSKSSFETKAILIMHFLPINPQSGFPYRALIPLRFHMFDIFPLFPHFPYPTCILEILLR